MALFLTPRIATLLLVSWCLISEVVPAFGQLDLSGTYKGFVKQEEGGLSSEYEFSLDIKIISPGIYEGSSIIKIPNSRFYGIMKIKVFESGSYLYFEEFSIISDFILGGSWCLKKGFLYVTIADGTTTLSGNWEGGEYCSSPGSLSVSKPNVKEK